MILHIVSFDCPFPPNYGGIIDVYHKIKALNNLGCRVILHVFYKEIPNRDTERELNVICKELHWYPRRQKWYLHLSLKPYIVRSRDDKRLKERLLSDKHPILLEGIHCSAAIDWMGVEDLNRVVIRMHNIEWKYYLGLSASEPLGWRKFYYWLESLKLRFREMAILRKRVTLAVISEADDQYFKEVKRYVPTLLIPPFHGQQYPALKTPRGEYILFHGDLTINDTGQWLLKKLIPILKELRLPAVIAGKANKEVMEKLTNDAGQIQLVFNPDRLRMTEIIKNAHICIVWSQISTGIKLKLLYSLFHSRYVVANSGVLEGNILEFLCYKVEDERGLLERLKALWQISYDEDENSRRKEVLEQLFNDGQNAMKLRQCWEIIKSA